MARRSNKIRIGFNVSHKALERNGYDVIKLHDDIISCFSELYQNYVKIDTTTDKDDKSLKQGIVDVVVYVDLNTANQAIRFKGISDLVNHLLFNIMANDVIVDTSEYIQPSHMSYIEDGHLNMLVRREGKEVIKTIFTDEYGVDPLVNNGSIGDGCSVSGIYLLGEENRVNKLTRIVSNNIRNGEFNFKTEIGIRKFYYSVLGKPSAQFKYIHSVVFKYIHNEIWNRNSFYVDVLIKLTNGKVYSYAKNGFVGGPTELEFHYYGVTDRENWDNASDNFLYQEFEQHWSVKI
ncbi:hypothetical protein RVBP14_0800 [Pseudomonas phage sp. Brmt]|nr:hypothetical protein RVBP14_0800 [Pseudomonas phage sp. Brmt]